jgi:CheY-like chemotaxis protein
MSTIDVLLVEDSPTDVLMVREALRDSALPIRLHVAQDGAQALDFLHQRREHAEAPRPAVMLLDLNLPRKDGREVLAEIKAHPELRRIPVVVLTTSRDEEDVLRSYDLHANCYVTKPVGLEQFLQVVRAIDDFWLAVVRLPPSAR